MWIGLLCVAIVATAGCSGNVGAPNAPDLVEPTESMYRTPPKGNLAGQPPRIDLLARGFQVRGEPSPQGYGYYIYLLFADNKRDTLALREAAADEFLELFKDVATVRSLEPEVPRARLALALAPMMRREDADSLCRRKDVRLLLEGYDYDQAALIRNLVTGQTKASVPRVALVGSTRPLRPGEAAADLTVTPLCGSASDVTAKMHQVADQLLIGSNQPRSTTLATRLRRIFDSLGSLVVMGTAIAGDKADALVADCP